MTQTRTPSIAAAKRAIIAQGGCGICGGPYAAHRMIDTQMEHVAAGDPIDVVADDYGLSVEEMVLRWMAYVNLLDRGA
jgi:hypothetical protein